MSALAAETTVNGQTLQSFFSITAEQLAQELDKDTLLRAAKGDGTFATWLIKSQWSSLSEHAASSACALLKANIVDIFAGAWCKFSELTKVAKETLEHPESTSHVSVGDHDFSYEIEPKLKILLDGKESGEIPFKVAITFTVTGMILEIAAGCVSKVNSGTLSWSVSMNCGSKQIWMRQLHTLDLPGELKLRHPVSILKEKPQARKPA